MLVVISVTYDWQATHKRNVLVGLFSFGTDQTPVIYGCEHKHMYQPDSNPQHGDLQSNAVITVLLQYPTTEM